jgi:hypothetical protein
VKVVLALLARARRADRSRESTRRAELLGTLERYRRRPLLPCVWFVELAAAIGALWSLTHGRTVALLLTASAYLIACGGALVVPGWALRRVTVALRLPVRLRRALHVTYLIVAAGLVAATLSSSRGWIAIVAILLTGNALWALEMHSREVEQAPAQPRD